MLRKLTEESVEIKVECLPEHEPIKGNAMCSGDDEFDREIEEKILNQLLEGNLWAWCCVKVSVKWHEFVAEEYLGCCSYASEEDFRKCVCFKQMKSDALEALNEKVSECWNLISPLIEG